MGSYEEQEGGFLLHRLVFENKINQVQNYLNATVMSKSKKLTTEESGEQLKSTIKDCHGNTALHLAVMLGRTECIDLLLDCADHRNSIDKRNTEGWTPLQEAISFGNRPTITKLLKAMRQRDKKSAMEKKSKALSILESFEQDIRLKIKWDFSSWLPFVSNMLPSDTCLVYCKNNRIRMDSTLEDFHNWKWVRGDLTLIADFNVQPKPKILLLDNNKKTYYRVDERSAAECEENLEEDVDLLMSCDIVDACIKSKQAHVSGGGGGESSGVASWLLHPFTRRSSEQRKERVGEFDARLYRVTNLVFVQKKRREHLREADVERNRKMKQALMDPRRNGTSDLLEEDDEELMRRTSLPPPDECRLTWDEYTRQHHVIGRQRKQKLVEKKFEASVSMCRDFPVKFDHLLTVLESLGGAKAKLYKRVREFTRINFPSQPDDDDDPGFPVKVNIPVVATIKAQLSFVEFEFCDKLDPSLFQVPDGYKRQNSWQKNK